MPAGQARAEHGWNDPAGANVPLGQVTHEVVLPGALAHARDEIRRALEEDRDVMVRVRGSLTDPSTCEILEYAIM